MNTSILTAKKYSRLQARILGMTIAEMPAGLWIIFIGIAMPLLALILTTVRYGLFVEAVRQAADAASQAQSYINTRDSNGNTILGAVTTAQDKASTVAALFSGLTVLPENVNCWIVITPLVNTGNGQAQGSTVVGPNVPLNTPPDPTQNLYQLRVDVTGQIQPIVSMLTDVFGGVPGLNQPMTVQVSMMRMFENPAGLYKPSGSGSAN